MSTLAEQAVIEIISYDGAREFRIAGPGQGDRKVWLATDAEGIYDAPVTTLWKSSAFQVGGTYKGKRYNQREVTFGVEILGDTAAEWQYNDSEWRRAWSYDEDSIMRVTTPLSGTRELRLRMSENPMIKSKKDPRILRHTQVPMACTAGQPMWTQPDDVTEWNLDAGQTSGADGVWVANPTDQVMLHKWQVDAPGTWLLPDFSWVGPEGDRAPGGEWADRMVPLPSLLAGQDATVDLDRMEEMITAADDTNLWGRMDGKFFMHPIPPYTQPFFLPVSVSGATSENKGVSLIQPRRWSRPWGME